jgi:hypothetical protein
LIAHLARGHQHPCILVAAVLQVRERRIKGTCRGRFW